MPINVLANWSVGLNLNGHELKKTNEAFSIQLNLDAQNSDATPAPLTVCRLA